MGEVVPVACQGFLVREVCVSVLVPRAQDTIQISGSVSSSAFTGQSRGNELFFQTKAK